MFLCINTFCTFVLPRANSQHINIYMHIYMYVFEAKAFLERQMSESLENHWPET